LANENFAVSTNGPVRVLQKVPSGDFKQLKGEIMRTLKEEEIEQVSGGFGSLLNIDLDADIKLGKLLKADVDADIDLGKRHRRRRHYC
jgi:hypothetical protein